MGIFTGLFKSRDKPQNSYDSPSYTYFFGRSSGGKRVTDRTALQHIAVYACVRGLSEAIAQLPLHVYKLIFIYSRYDEQNPNFKEQGEIILPADQVLHIVGLGYDGLVGYSPIAMAKNAIGLAVACDEYGTSFFRKRK